MNTDNFNNYYGAGELRKLTYYLVSLFYKANCKYSCTRKKINRLLTIYVLCNIKNKPNLRDSNFAITDCFMGFYNLTFLIPDTIYYTDLTATIKNTISHDNKIEIKERFEQTNNIYTQYDNELNEASKKLLEVIFRKFANYPITDLSNKVDKIKEYAPLRQNKDGAINIDKFLLFLNNKENNKIYKDNEIFKFIKNFCNMEKNIMISQTNDSIYSKEELVEQLKEKCNKLMKVDSNEILYELSEILDVIKKIAKQENKSLKDVEKILKKKHSNQ